MHTSARRAEPGAVSTGLGRGSLAWVSAWRSVYVDGPHASSWKLGRAVGPKRRGSCPVSAGLSSPCVSTLPLAPAMVSHMCALGIKRSSMTENPTVFAQAVGFFTSPPQDDVRRPAIASASSGWRPTKSARFAALSSGFARRSRYSQSGGLRRWIKIAFNNTTSFQTHCTQMRRKSQLSRRSRSAGGLACRVRHVLVLAHAPGACSSALERFGWSATNSVHQ